MGLRPAKSHEKPSPCGAAGPGCSRLSGGFFEPARGSRQRNPAVGFRPCRRRRTLSQFPAQDTLSKGFSSARVNAPAWRAACPTTLIGNASPRRGCHLIYKWKKPPERRLQPRLAAPHSYRRAAAGRAIAAWSVMGIGSAAASGLVSPSTLRTSVSTVWRMSGLSFRNWRALSRPCPIRSPL
jgi:hypothetical protein